MKKFLGWMVLILVVFYVGTNPGPAAQIARGIGAGFGHAFDNVGVFLRNLTT